MTRSPRGVRLMVTVCEDATFLSVYRWTFAETGQVWFSIYSHRLHEDFPAEPIVSTQDEKRAKFCYAVLVEARGGPVAFWRAMLYALTTRLGLVLNRGSRHKV